jgi:undecaprenyl-diphosphatase
LSVYFGKLWGIATRLSTDASARRFVYAILLAFLPAMVIGSQLHSFIKGTLFNSPMLICIVLILGGIILLVIDRIDFKPVHHNAMEYPLPMAFKIGLCQCLAMIPGTSRSGATIVGSMLLGADKRSAAEFSFFLAMPTMAGAFAYDLYKNWKHLNRDDGLTIFVGFVAAFCAGLLVVRALLDFISRHGFLPFAIWRIGIGTAGIIGLLLGK